MHARRGQRSDQQSTSPSYNNTYNLKFFIIIYQWPKRKRQISSIKRQDQHVWGLCFCIFEVLGFVQTAQLHLHNIVKMGTINVYAIIHIKWRDISKKKGRCKPNHSLWIKHKYTDP